MINFLIGQLVGLVEPFLDVGFVIKCLGWKDSVKHPKELYAGICLMWFVVAQGNGKFPGSYNIIVAFDMCLVCFFSFLFLEQTTGMKFMICILMQIINSACTLSIMQVTAYIINTSIFNYLKIEGVMFQVGAVMSKILLWLIYKKTYPSFKYLLLYFPKDQIVLTNVLIGFTIVSEACIFQAVSQKEAGHYTIAALLIVSFGIFALSSYVIYMMITISKKNEKMQLYQLIELKNQEQERQLEELQHSEENIRKFRHDYKNHCMNMENLLNKGDYESLHKYLKQFSTNELGEELFVHSDSPIINAVLNNKRYICRERRIDISCDITGSVKCIDDIGVGSILFNLLDNAIEACEKNIREKRIVCQILQENDEVNIFVKNSVEQSVLTERRLPDTTKRNKDQHGIGHLIVEEQVKKLDGMIEYYEEGMFCAHVYLPL